MDEIREECFSGLGNPPTLSDVSSVLSAYRQRQKELCEIKQLHAEAHNDALKERLKKKQQMYKVRRFPCRSEHFSRTFTKSILS